MKEYTKIKTAQTIICDMCNELHPDEPCRQSACEWMQWIEEDAIDITAEWTKVEDGCQKTGLTYFAGMNISAMEVTTGCSELTGLGINITEIGRGTPLSDTRREFWRGCRCLIRQKGKRSGAANDDWMCKRDDVVRIVMFRKDGKNGI